MALTRKSLSAMGIEPEKVDQIIEEYLATFNEIKEERDELKQQLSKNKDVESELSESRKKNETLEADLQAANEIVSKYEKLKTEYDDYKNTVEEKAKHSEKVEAYRSLLIEAGVSEKRISSILKVSDVDSIEFDTEGKIKNAEKLTEEVKNEWSDFIQTNTQIGANTSNPPINQGGNVFEKMNLAEKMSYANENPDSKEVKAWLEEK